MIHGLTVAVGLWQEGLPIAVQKLKGEVGVVQYGYGFWRYAANIQCISPALAVFQRDLDFYGVAAHSQRLGAAFARLHFFALNGDSVVTLQRGRGDSDLGRGHIKGVAQLVGKKSTHHLLGAVGDDGQRRKGGRALQAKSAQPGEDISLIGKAGLQRHPAGLCADRQDTGKAGGLACPGNGYLHRLAIGIGIDGTGIQR